MTKKTQQSPAFNKLTAEVELREYCSKAGLVWNDGNWQAVVPMIEREGLTHRQAVEAVKVHITLVAHLFNPAAYPWKGRLLLAAHFLFNFSRKKKPTA